MSHPGTTRVNFFFLIYMRSCYYSAQNPPQASQPSVQIQTLYPVYKALNHLASGSLSDLISSTLHLFLHLSHTGCLKHLKQIQASGPAYILPSIKMLFPQLFTELFPSGFCSKVSSLKKAFQTHFVVTILYLTYPVLSFFIALQFR